MLDRNEKIALAIASLWTVLVLAFFGGCIYVAWHFIAKYW